MVPTAGHETVRQRFRPERIRILLLGESPPPGRGFFYTADSSLYRFTSPVLQEECGFPLEPRAFLSRFAGPGFYLDDYSPRRSDKPAQRASDPDIRSAVERIASNISANAPVFVVGVLLSLEELVDETVASSNHPETPWRCLHFPHPRNEQGQRRYQSGLREVLRTVGCERKSD